MNSESCDYGELLEAGMDLNLVGYDDRAFAGCYTYRLFRHLRSVMRDLEDRMYKIHLPNQPDSNIIVHLSEKQGRLVQHHIQVVCMPAYVRDAYRDAGGTLADDDTELVIVEGFKGTVLLGSY